MGGVAGGGRPHPRQHLSGLRQLSPCRPAAISSKFGAELHVHRVCPGNRSQRLRHLPVLLRPIRPKSAHRWHRRTPWPASCSAILPLPAESLRRQRMDGHRTHLHLYVQDTYQRATNTLTLTLGFATKSRRRSTTRAGRPWAWTSRKCRRPGDFRQQSSHELLPADVLHLRSGGYPKSCAYTDKNNLRAALRPGLADRSQNRVPHGRRNLLQPDGL